MTYQATASDNWQQQVDEVTALSAIFGDDFQLAAVHGLPGGLPPEGLTPETLQDLPMPTDTSASLVCIISVDVVLPEAELPLLLTHGQGQDPSDAQQYPGGTVRHLPPIAVKLEMHSGYPSQDPPLATLQALWLPPEWVVRLQQQLQALWEDQGAGAPVCFTWLDWLKHSCLPHLGAAHSLLVPSHAAQQGPSAEQVLMHLLRYDALQEAEDFAQGTWQCSICFDEVRGTECVRLPACGHHFCRECLGQDCRLKVKDGAVDSIRCPDPQCKEPLHPSTLKTLLAPEEYERWEGLLLARTLDRMQDVVYCPRCSSSTIEDPDHMAQCARCLYVFCSLCNDSWHPGSECMDAAAKLELMQQRRDRAGGTESAEKLRKQADLVNQLMSLKAVHSSSKQCPKCHMAISKTEGCNKMTCSYCSTLFCYNCGVEVPGYEHFRDGGCRLFDAEDLVAWERAMAVHNQLPAMGHFMVQAMAGDPGARLCRCPVCGQQNVKEGQNNAMRCWACSSHFCYSCRTAIRGRGAVGLHFTRSQNGQRPCRQHSPD